MFFAVLEVFGFGVGRFVKSREAEEGQPIHIRVLLPQ